MPAKKNNSIKKKAAKKKTVKKVAAKKKKPTTKKTTAKKTPAKKAARTKRTARKPASPKVKKTPAKKKSIRKKPGSAKKKHPAVQETSVSRSTEAERGKPAPIVFSLDDVEELMAAKKSAGAETEQKVDKKPAKKAPAKKITPKKAVVDDTPSEKRVHQAASLADILGFNPAEKKTKIDLAESEIPKKWKKYYKLLVQLRAHLSEEITLHTSETLKHASRDDSGDLSSYGSHQADAGTDTFDRDFALSLVSSEQEALNEIEEAILRIKDGSYGACEVTGKPIPAARLTAVPFTRYSVEGQAEYEKNLRRKTDRSNPGGLFADSADAPKIASSDDDDD